MNDPVRPSSLFGTPAQAAGPSGVLGTIHNPPKAVTQLATGGAVADGAADRPQLHPQFIGSLDGGVEEPARLMWQCAPEARDCRTCKRISGS